MNENKGKIHLAIIIPTLNEEKYIGKLLDSIINQTKKPTELVVIDASSKDKTIYEIKKRQTQFPQLRIFKIPKYTVARQRNFGVKETKSPNILFLDADMELRKRDDLERYIAEIEKKKPDAAVSKNLPDSNKWGDKIYFKLEDLTFKITRFLWPVISARNFYVKREVFYKVGGFDEKIKVGEDQELLHRILKNNGKFIFLKDVALYTSIRRVAKEGRIRYALKMILFGLDILLKGHYKSRVEYEFGNFKKT